MDECKQAIVNAVTNGGGSIEWGIMIAAIPTGLQRYTIKALRELEAEGKVKRRIDGTVVPPTFRVVTGPGV
jgi:phosphoenolpyruvate synthase/pyruvate phosphate dikinase